MLTGCPHALYFSKGTRNQQQIIIASVKESKISHLENNWYNIWEWKA